MHKGITARYVGLASNDNPNEPKSQLNPLTSATPPFIPIYSTFIDPTHSDHIHPFLLRNRSALAIDVQNESSLFHTRQRDIHDAGIVLMQMRMRLDMVTRIHDPQSACSTFSSQSPYVHRYKFKLTCRNTLHSEASRALHSPFFPCSVRLDRQPYHGLSQNLKIFIDVY